MSKSHLSSSSSIHWKVGYLTKMIGKKAMLAILSYLLLRLGHTTCCLHSINAHLRDCTATTPFYKRRVWHLRPAARTKGLIASRALGPSELTCQLTTFQALSALKTQFVLLNEVLAKIWSLGHLLTNLRNKLFVNHLGDGHLS